MTYTAASIGISEALLLMKARGIEKPHGQLLAALRDGAVRASGLVDGSRREILPTWWHHLNSDLDHTVWFDPKNTEPPTPFRAEAIDLPRVQLDQHWPEPDSDVSQFSQLQAPPATGRRRGPKPVKGPAITAAMLEDLRTDRIGMDGLRDMKEVALAAKYDASRDTVRKARQKALETIVNEEMPTNGDN